MKKRGSGGARTYHGEQVDGVVQEDQFGAGLDPVDGAVEEGGSSLRLHLSLHVEQLSFNLGAGSTREAHVKHTPGSRAQRLAHDDRTHHGNVPPY